MAWKETIEQHFPGAMPGPEFTKKVIAHLDGKEGFTPENTVFGHSTCPDEINRGVTTFGDHYGESFTMGGLSGYPFTGKTGYAAFSHHAPDNEGTPRLMILYGPHIGITESGELGKFQRRGMSHETTACGSLVGAYNQLREFWDKNKVYTQAGDSKDQQQEWVGTLLTRKFPQIVSADFPIKEATMVMAHATDNAVLEIVQDPNASFTGLVALVGGVQINTPNGNDNYFLAQRFAIYNPGTGEMKDLMHALE